LGVSEAGCIIKSPLLADSPFSCLRFLALLSAALMLLLGSGAVEFVEAMFLAIPERV
jgi:hypothetical protein